MASSLVAKLSLLLVLVAMAEASSFWSKLGSFEEDEYSNKKERHRPCRVEVSHRQIDAWLSCIRYGEPPVVVFGRNYQAPPRECCEQLQSLERPECRCQALRKMADVLREEGGYHRKEPRKEAKRRALRLPGMCGMEPSDCGSSRYSFGY